MASAAVAVASVWIGLVLSYAFPRLPPSFSIMAVVAAGYLLAVVGGRVTVWATARRSGTRRVAIAGIA